MNKWIRSVVAAGMLFGSAPAFAVAAPSPTGAEQLILNQGTNEIIHNGIKTLAAQPHAIKQGVTYVAAKSIMPELYGTVSYDAGSKQYILRSGTIAIGFTVNQKNYKLNGATKAGIGVPYIEKGTLMVPLKTLATHFGIELKNNPALKRAEMTWSTKPVARFSVSDAAPYAQQTKVTYKNEAFSPRGYKIVAERWENDYETFEAAGSYTVTHWVQDETGMWSDPYTVVVNAKAPNEPPVASFTTGKDTYRIGEPIGYSDNSSDDENAIASREWTNNAKAFFEPGEQTITLKVTDVHGETSVFSKTVAILDEIANTKDEFDLQYAPLGDKIAVNGADVLTYKLLSSASDASEQMTLLRENSPESIASEGIYYASTELSGNVRFMLHNHNKRSSAVKVYIVATNRGTSTAHATMGPIGIGGPNLYVSFAGKGAVGKYLESRLANKSTPLDIPPGESRIVFPEISAKTVDPGDVYSMYADAYFDRDVDVKIVILDASKNVFSALPGLPLLNTDGHVRGTFEHANRVIEVNDTVGAEKARMVFGDGVNDPRLYGVDQTIANPTLNSGNYGVLYTVKLNNVAPNTAILVNPRGGFYAGAFTVNGKVVYTTSNTILNNSSEASVLYRTSYRPESVTITFTPASGSYLPINLLFVPMKSS